MTNAERGLLIAVAEGMQCLLLPTNPPMCANHAEKIKMGVEALRQIIQTESQMVPDRWDTEDRVQWLIDNWPEKLEDGGITFPDGEFWAVK